MQDYQQRSDASSSATAADAATEQNPLEAAWGWVSDHVIEPTHEAVDSMLEFTGFGNSGLHDLLFGPDEAGPENGKDPAPPTTKDPAPVEDTPWNILPTSAKEADPDFVTQFYTKEWNPTGPSGSTNCGPASLAMLMNTMGKMPSGLSAEQQIDHARALMYPNSGKIKTIEVDGQEVEILDDDHALTTKAAIAEGIDKAGGKGEEDSGWDALDKQLDGGSPVVLYGHLDDAWRKKFPERVGSGDLDHFNAVVGKTEDGKYIVMDPMHTGGPVEMSKDDLSEFFNDGDPDFVAWENPKDKEAAPAS